MNEQQPITESLKGMLDDPETMKSILSLAGSLMGSLSSGEPDTEKEPSSSHPTEAEENGKSEPSGMTGTADQASAPDIRSLFPKGTDLSRLGSEKQQRLIRALRPYLSPRRRETADSILRLMTVLRLAGTGLGDGKPPQHPDAGL